MDTRKSLLIIAIFFIGIIAQVLEMIQLIEISKSVHLTIDLAALWATIQILRNGYKYNDGMGW